jgi:hypothetical protein
LGCCFCHLVFVDLVWFGWMPGGLTRPCPRLGRRNAVIRGQGSPSKRFAGCVVTPFIHLCSAVVLQSICAGCLVCCYPLLLFIDGKWGYGILDEG